MGVRHRSDGDDTVLREEWVGGAFNRICYPSVSSCITVTAPSPHGIVGAHITFGTPLVDVDTLFSRMRTGGASSCPVIYVAGRFANFKASTVAALNTRKKIGAHIRASINRAATVKFYDTSALGATHIFAEKYAGVLGFFWIAEHGNNVVGFTYPDFAARTAIPIAAFIVR